MRRPTAYVIAAAIACAASAGPGAYANAPPPPGPGVEETGWRLADGEVWTLVWGSEDGIAIACPEGKKTLEVYATPAWETGYATADGKVFDGSLETVSVTFGDKSFDATLVPKAKGMKDEDYFPVYAMPADADSVTAVMLATNAKVTLKSDPQQTREGEPDDGGAFDMFATTCAQINGLK
jgi:hypothetical protein